LLKAPSKVKRELEQFEVVLGKLSQQARAELYWNTETATAVDHTIDRLQNWVHKAIDNHESGHTKSDFVRMKLGLSAAELWLSHAGDIDSPDFKDFLEILIEEANLDDGNKARADAVNLASDLKGPPWNKGKKINPSQTYTKER
jgi:hypothetical protein